MNLRCDIFCAVVDNLGDAGVCWRLARQLAARRPWAIRLWIDDPAPLAGLAENFDPFRTEQTLASVEIRRWLARFPEVEAADVVVEAFACDLPASYVAAMAERKRPPVWINLEYLSAEAWIRGCHAQASPHPSLPLLKHFFFPGFVPGTGGLLGDADGDFSAAPPENALNVSLFCYDAPALPSLLDAWAEDAHPLSCLVADGLPRRQVEIWLGSPFPVGQRLRRGSLSLAALPFVPQPDYDRRLASCALNFVRGEDSFVRAQWAAHPLVWHIYPQDGDAHLDKLAAFLDLYLAEVPARARLAATDFWFAWNRGQDMRPLWPTFRAALPLLAQHAEAWRERIRLPGELAENLALFVESRL